MTEVERTEVEHRVEEQTVTDVYCDICGHKTTNYETATVDGEERHFHTSCADTVFDAGEPSTTPPAETTERTVVPPVLQEANLSEAAARWRDAVTCGVKRYGMLLLWPIVGLWLGAEEEPLGVRLGDDLRATERYRNGFYVSLMTWGLSVFPALLAAGVMRNTKISPLQTAFLLLFTVAIPLGLALLFGLED